MKTSALHPSRCHFLFSGVLVALVLGSWPGMAAAPHVRAQAQGVEPASGLGVAAVLAAAESVGIGVALGVDESTKMPLIVKVFPGSSAAEAGLAEGDLIREINGVQATGLAIEQCVTMIRGDAGTIVTLEVLRAADGTAIVLKLKRRAFRLTGG